VFYGLHSEFKDLITSLAIKVEPLSYVDLHSDLITHEFLHKTSLQSMVVTTPFLPMPPLQPSTIIEHYQSSATYNNNPNFSRGRVDPPILT